MLMFYHEEVNNKQQFDVIDDKGFEILKNMMNDIHKCHYCIATHSSPHIKTKILQVHQLNMEKDLKIRNIRLVLNLSALMNMLIIYIVYGGPQVINRLLIINGVFIIIAPFIENLHYMIYIESSVILVSTVIAIQSSYSIIIAGFEIYTRRFIKVD